MSEPAAPPFSITPYLEVLLEKQDLDAADAKALMLEIVEGRVAPASIAAFLTALRAKGEHEVELAAFATVMREHCVRIQAPEGTLDTCGTGGDGSATFNISTATALVCAGMGIPVAKHGNRSVSSRSGSSEVLKSLGVNVEAAPPVVERCLREARIGFLFAPALHPGMRHVAPVRRELGIRTVFNLLGPLSNPAGARRQLLGVYHPKWCEPFARALLSLGSEAALVVCGMGPGGDGYLDEISTWGPTTVARLQDGAVNLEQFDAQALGFSAPSPSALAIETPEASAMMIRAILSGSKGPPREIVIANAAGAAQAAGRARSWQEGAQLAAAAIDEGKAKLALQQLVDLSHSK